MMRLRIFIHAVLPLILILSGCAMQGTGDHKNTDAKPLVHERYIGGDLYRSGTHIHHHPERIPPAKKQSDE